MPIIWFWLDPSKFDNKNRLKVTPELLIVGETNVYAIGDCCNTSEEKLAAHACAHARTVAFNIWRDIKGKAKKPYTQSKYFYQYCHDSCFVATLFLKCFGALVIKLWFYYQLIAVHLFPLEQRVERVWLMDFTSSGLLLVGFSDEGYSHQGFGIIWTNHVLIERLAIANVLFSSRPNIKRWILQQFITNRPKC